MTDAIPILSNADYNKLSWAQQVEVQLGQPVPDEYKSDAVRLCEARLPPLRAARILRAKIEGWETEVTD